LAVVVIGGVSLAVAALLCSLVVDDERAAPGEIG
jgi:hypothetical protein